MQFLTLPFRVNPPEFNSSPYADTAFYTATAPEPPVNLREFILNHRVIPLEGGRYCLRLQKNLKLEIISDMQFEVKDWGIKMECSELAQLPREIARRFIFLLSEAEAERLTETDQATWIRILDYVDFRQFSIDRSPPRYMQGTVRSKKEKFIVEWHDGKIDILSRFVAESLSEINVGETFAAHIKLGRDDEVIGIERVLLLGSTSSDEGKDWEAWPKKG